MATNIFGEDDGDTLEQSGTVFRGSWNEQPHEGNNVTVTESGRIASPGLHEPFVLLGMFRKLIGDEERPRSSVNILEASLGMTCL
jgi:hypothetical protein